MKYYVIKTTRNGIEYKRTKCLDSFTKEKSEAYQYSKQGAEDIAKRLNDQLHESWKDKIHYNTLAVNN